MIPICLTSFQKTLLPTTTHFSKNFLSHPFGFHFEKNQCQKITQQAASFSKYFFSAKLIFDAITRFSLIGLVSNLSMIFIGVMIERGVATWKAHEKALQTVIKSGIQLQKQNKEYKTLNQTYKRLITNHQLLNKTHQNLSKDYRNLNQTNQRLVHKYETLQKKFELQSKNFTDTTNRFKLEVALLSKERQKFETNNQKQLALFIEQNNAAKELQSKARLNLDHLKLERVKLSTQIDNLNSQFTQKTKKLAQLNKAYEEKNQKYQDLNQTHMKILKDLQSVQLLYQKTQQEFQSLMDKKKLEKV